MPLLGGSVFSHIINGWKISWESNNNYRHWCYMQHQGNDKEILLVLFNPGSLANDGTKLYQDQTLRILRGIFKSTGFNPFIINLFDYSDTRQNKLYSNWESRDYKSLVFEKLVAYDFSWIVYAYGKIETTDIHYNDIISRINQVRKIFAIIPEFKIDNLTAHPRRWYFTKSIDRIHNLFCNLYKT